MVLFYLLPTTATTICRAMACETFQLDFNGDHVEKWMLADLSISCDSNPTYDAILVYAILMILVYPIGIPMFFTVLLWRNRAAIENRESPGGDESINHLEFLFSSYGERDAPRLSRSPPPPNPSIPPPSLPHLCRPTVLDVRLGGHASSAQPYVAARAALGPGYGESGGGMQ